MDNEIYHHGIKGQKWGRRRFQNSDGSLTAEGRKRYNVGVETAKEQVKRAQKDYRKAYSKNLLVPTKKNTDAYNAAQEKLSWEKDKLATAKIKSKWESRPHKKSKRELKLAQQYLEKGMTQEEAEIAAYKRVKTERILAVTAGVTAASLAAYAAYKHYDKTVDKIIKPDTMLQNISVDSNKGISDAFYFSTNKTDNAKYAGIYTKQLRSQLGASSFYKTKIRVNDGIKVASEKSAARALSELIRKDPNNAKIIKNELSRYRDAYAAMGDIKGAAMFERASKSLTKGKVNSNMYDAFNRMLVYDSSGGYEAQQHNALRKNFFDLLKSKGYGAIMDMNDKKYSGYSAKAAIAFDVANKATVDSITKLTDSEMKKSAIRGAIDIYGKMAVKELVPLGVATGAVAAVSSASSGKKRDEIVKEYRKKHPDTKLSYNEIINQHYKTK